MKLKLGDLRLAEPFISPSTGKSGYVLDWGYTRTFQSDKVAGPRLRLPTVVTEIDGKRKLMSPEMVVYVEPDRLRWTEDRKPVPAERWHRYVGDDEEEEN